MKRKNFQTQEVPFAKNARGISKVYHEVFLLMKFQQTKPQVKNMNINYFDFYHTVIDTRDESEVVDNQYENNENDYINFNDIVPNLYIGTTTRETILK